MSLIFMWRNYQYFPYEQQLAYEEVRNLFGGKPKETSSGLLINSGRLPENWQELASRTTYFSKVISERLGELIPEQFKFELSINGFSKGENSLEPLRRINRQSTRYSSHGLHEYKGKFNPQIVRAIINILNIGQGDWLLDPFCGSGTSLVEAEHIGLNAIGFDVNPLAIQIANAKIQALKINPTALMDAAKRLIDNVHSFDKKKADISCGSLPNFDYLQKWFTNPILLEVDFINKKIRSLNPKFQLIFKIMLSDILRDVSLQDPDDLRIRRREFPENVSAINLFSKTVLKKINLIIGAYHLIPKSKSLQEAVFLDTAHLNGDRRRFDQFDAAITSPPYATALPYIDTQRLSLAALGLLDFQQIRLAERTLIGTREISDKYRVELEDKIKSNTDNLPSYCIKLCRELLDHSMGSDNGFRRKNVPALIYKYLVEMQKTFVSVRNLLRRGASYVLIVGPSKTSLSGIDFLIDTPKLLASLAENTGFTVESLTDLDVYKRFDLHSNNSIKKEVMLHLRKK
jgi:hypothetical protein